MPFVPNVPGVPALSSYIPNNLTLLLGDAAGLILGALGVQTWGIFLDGIPVLSYDNFVSFEYSQDWDISTYPVESGSFASYDKVQNPSEIRVRISAGADVLNRQAMLDTIDLQMSTTITYDIVTPETVYLNYNFRRREYDRAAEKVGLIVVDLYFIEIIQTATALFQNVANAAFSGQVSVGNTIPGSTSPNTAGQVSASGWQ